VNGNVISIKGRNITVAYHPDGGEPRRGDALLVLEQGQNGAGVLAQVIDFDSASYPGDTESALHELLETTIAERYDLVAQEPALTDLKQIKLAKLKIRKSLRGNRLEPWDGHIPSRNVVIQSVDPDVLLTNILPANPLFSLAISEFEGRRVVTDAMFLDKVNVITGDKGTGKSHLAKLVVNEIVQYQAPTIVFDVNREFTDLPGAVSLRAGDNYRFSLGEVGFPFVMALIDEMNPLTDVSRGAFEFNGPRFMNAEIQASGYATIGYLREQAERSRFHSNDMVNGAIEQRLRMLENSGLFENNPAAPSFAQRLEDAVQAGGFLVLDLAEQRPGRLQALARGLLRRVEAICREERQSGRERYPFLFFEEAHMYAAPTEILNLITRGRHLGLTVFFMTNSPSKLDEVVFRQIDNLFVTGLSHSADLRLISKSALSDEDTLESLAVGLGATQALFIGRVTDKYPLVVDVDPLPDGFPATGATRSFWDAARLGGRQAGAA
jgi:hypothetical protein